MPHQDFCEVVEGLFLGEPALEGVLEHVRGYLDPGGQLLEAELLRLDESQIAIDELSEQAQQGCTLLLVLNCLQLGAVWNKYLADLLSSQTLAADEPAVMLALELLIAVEVF